MLFSYIYLLVLWYEINLYSLNTWYIFNYHITNLASITPYFFLIQTKENSSFTIIIKTKQNNNFFHISFHFTFYICSFSTFLLPSSLQQHIFLLQILHSYLLLYLLQIYYPLKHLFSQINQTALCHRPHWCLPGTIIQQCQLSKIIPLLKTLCNSLLSPLISHQNPLQYYVKLISRVPLYYHVASSLIWNLSKHITYLLQLLSLKTLKNIHFLHRLSIQSPFLNNWKLFYMPVYFSIQTVKISITFCLNCRQSSWVM